VDLGGVRRGQGDLRGAVPPEGALTPMVMTEEGMTDAEGHPGGGRMVVGGHPHRPFVLSLYLEVALLLQGYLID